MGKEGKLPVDVATTKAIIKEAKYTFKKIEEETNGEITENIIKKIMSVTKKADGKTLDILAGLLDCNRNDFIDKDYLISLNLPFEMNKIVGSLYKQNIEDINIHYAERIKEFRTNVDLRTMLNEAHRLFLTLSSDDFFFDKNYFVKAFNIIKTDFIKDNCIGNMQLTGIQDTFVSNLYLKIINASGEYNTQQVILMFLYVFIIFDAIFLEEAVASAIQLVPERRTEKADQYCILTYRSERMRDTLINLILNKGFVFDTPEITDLGIDDEVTEGITLMLAACERCYKHINGIYSDSEYVNRKELSAILSKLEEIFRTLSIPLPDSITMNEYVKMYMTRFNRLYTLLKSYFNKLNPSKKPQNKRIDEFDKGVWVGWIMNTLKSN